jgi:hypothetical protein
MQEYDKQLDRNSLIFLNSIHRVTSVGQKEGTKVLDSRFVTTIYI